MIEKGIQTGIVKGMEVGREKVKVAHLQFADDTIFFLDGERNFTSMMRIVEGICLASGMRINKEKSVLLGINMEETEVGTMAERVGYKHGSWPMTYLGAPLGGNPIRDDFWEGVVRRVRRRLDGWKKAHISKGGRMVLIQAVLRALPTYLMSTFKMPKRIAGELEKMMRDFLWENFEGGVGAHLVSWEKVTRPKEKGGLGLGNLVARNRALVAKWLWRIGEEGDSLWKRIIVSKFGPPNSWGKGLKGRGITYRSPWKFISSVAEEYQMGVRWVLGDGRRIRFWSDIWVGEEALGSRFPGLCRLSGRVEGWVGDLVRRSGDGGVAWDFAFSRRLGRAERALLTELESVLGGVVVRENGGDIRKWKAGEEGIFTVKSMLAITTGAADLPDYCLHSIIWKAKVPSKVKFFMWLLDASKLSTQDSCQKRYPYICLLPSRCPLCEKSEETTDHIFLHCQFSVLVWGRFLEVIGLQTCLPISCGDFLYEVISRMKGKRRKAMTSILMMSICWEIWRERNKRLFEGKKDTTQGVWDRSMLSATSWLIVLEDFKSYSFTEVITNMSALYAKVM